MNFVENRPNSYGNRSAIGRKDMVGTISKYARYFVTALWVVGGGWLAIETVVEARQAWTVVAAPPEIIKDVTIRNVPDDEGRKASFRIMLFSDEFRWRINSFDALEQAGKRPQFTPEMKAVLNNAVEIITVGASSEEIPPGVGFPQGRAREEQRAARRAEKIAVWIARSADKPIPCKLNVGHHAPTAPTTPPNSAASSSFSCSGRTRGINIDQSRRAAMAGERARPVFEALLTSTAR